MWRDTFCKPHDQVWLSSAREGRRRDWERWRDRISTPSQLRFIKPNQDDASPDDPTGVAQVYKHSNGYPPR
jgi:hypothetical protein